MVTQQFDLFRNVNNREAYPYLLVVQHPLLAQLHSRVVVPFMSKKKFGTPVARLHPVFTIVGVEMVMLTHLIGAVPTGSLGPVAASLNAKRAQIIDALDTLLTG